MIEAIVFLWLFLLIFIDYRARVVERKLNELEKKLLKQSEDKNDSKVIDS